MIFDLAISARSRSQSKVKVHYISIYRKTSKDYSSEIAKRFLFILGNNDPWMKTFKSYILFVHMLKVKVTVKGRISLNKHIVKLQKPTSLKPLSGFVHTGSQ